jgi:hypothetical protein
MSIPDKIKWGWFRLLLGVTQMVFSVLGALFLFTLGLDWRTIGATLIATSAAVMSRRLYRGKTARERRMETLFPR